MCLVGGIRTATKIKGNNRVFSDGLVLHWTIHADTQLCSKHLLNLQRVQTVVKNKLLKCFEYTVYKQSSCKHMRQKF